MRPVFDGGVMAAGGVCAGGEVGALVDAVDSFAGEGLGGCGRRVLGEVGHIGVVAGGWVFLWGVGFWLRVLCSCWGGWCGCLCSHVLGCRVVWFTRLGVVLVWWAGLGLG